MTFASRFARVCGHADKPNAIVQQLLATVKTGVTGLDIQTRQPGLGWSRRFTFSLYFFRILLKMSLRRGLIIVVAVALLGLGIYVGLGYFTPQKSVQRLTGWTVPDAATLRVKNAEGDPFNGERNYLFDLPASTLSDEAFCAFLNLPAASEKTTSKAGFPAAKPTTLKLDTAPMCSRNELDKKRKTALSIEATRTSVVVRWIYM